MTDRVWTALLLTTAAGMATTIGSLIALVVKNPGRKFMGFTLGFSAGVMILVSFTELLQESIEKIGYLPAHASFFTGMIAFFLIDFLIPHTYIGQEDYNSDKSKDRLGRTGLLVAVGIMIHNFPEGMATFVAALEDLRLGVGIAIAIAIHNIPEGLAVAAPIYAATGSRKKAFWWSFLSGASEPAGAVVAALVLMPILNASVLGMVLAFVGGLMVAISIDELVPAAKSFDTEHIPLIGVLLGMAVMAFSLYLF